MSVERMPRGSEFAPRVLLPGFAGTEVPSWLGEAIEAGLAGVCLFAGNVSADDPEGTAVLAEALRAHRSDVIVALDEEGGVVTRLEAPGGSTLASPAQLGLLPAQATARTGSILAERLRAAGVTVVLAPDGDVNDNLLNPVIGARSFGADPAVVAERVAAAVTAIQAGGVAACVKHWPGHGDTAVDSHRGLPTVPEHTAERHAAPFAAAFGAEAAAVMTAHIVVPEWGSAPVTLNAAALARLRALTDAVIVTDAVDMAAVAADAGPGAAGVRAIAAGADLVCIGNPQLAGVDDAAQYREVADAVAAAVDDGRIPLARIREAADRVARLAARYPAAPVADSRPNETAMQKPAPDAAIVDALAAALAEASTVDPLALARIAAVRDARRGPSIAVATRARPVSEWLAARAGVAGSAPTVVVADRLDDDQRAVIDDARAQGAYVVVNVGPIGQAAPHPTVELGADSPLSVCVLETWLGGGAR